MLKLNSLIFLLGKTVPAVNYTVYNLVSFLLEKFTLREN